MEIPDDEEEQNEKSFIRARCPVLRVLLDEDVKVDITTWVNELKTKYTLLHSEILEIIGETKFNEEIERFAEVAAKYDIFNEKVEHGNKSFFTAIIASIGYEIGSERENQIFYGDIFEQIVITFPLLHNSREAATFTLEVLDAGARWKKEAASDVPEEFKNFEFDLP